MGDKFGADPILRNKFEFYDMTPHEMQVDLWKRVNVLYNKYKDECFVKSVISPPYVDFNSYFQGSLPGVGLTSTMFRAAVEHMANEEQRARWLPSI